MLLEERYAPDVLAVKAAPYCAGEWVVPAPLCIAFDEAIVGIVSDEGLQQMQYAHHLCHILHRVGVIYSMQCHLRHGVSCGCVSLGGEPAAVRDRTSRRQR